MLVSSLIFTVLSLFPFLGFYLFHPTLTWQCQTILLNRWKNHKRWKEICHHHVLFPSSFTKNCPFIFITYETAVLQWSLGRVIQENFPAAPTGTTLELQNEGWDFSFSTRELTTHIFHLFHRLSIVRVPFYVCSTWSLSFPLPSVWVVPCWHVNEMQPVMCEVLCWWVQTSTLQAVVKQSPVAPDVTFYKNTAWDDFFSAP